MKRVGIVTLITGSPWGGSEELWLRTALELLKVKIKVRVNIFDWGKKERKFFREFVQLGGEIIARPRNKSRNIFSKLKGRFLSKLLFFDWFYRKKHDLMIISGGVFRGAEWMEECMRKGVPYVVIIQVANELTWPDDSALDRYRVCYEKAARCFFASVSSKECVEFQLGVDLPKAKAIFNPTSLKNPKILEWPKPNPPPVFRFACVGRLDPDAKGQDILFKVLSKEKWRRRNLEVEVWGEGKNKNTLKKIVSKLDLRNVFFNGTVDDMTIIWRNCHALVLPSRFEGLPLVIVEAMLLGRPCIVTDVGGNCEVIKDNVNGFIAKAPTVNELDECLERAWMRRDDLQSMGVLAATAIRQVMPENPERVFAHEILEFL